MITIAPSLSPIPPHDSAVSGADNSADSTKNFFSLLLALFLTGAAQPQSVQPPQSKESLPSTGPLQSQTATRSSSLAGLSEGKDTQELGAAVSDKKEETTNPMSSEQNFLLSLLFPIVGGQAQPLMNPLQAAQTSAPQPAVIETPEETPPVKRGTDEQGVIPSEKSTGPEILTSVPVKNGEQVEEKPEGQSLAARAAGGAPRTTPFPAQRVQDVPAPLKEPALMGSAKPTAPAAELVPGDQTATGKNVSPPSEQLLPAGPAKEKVLTGPQDARQSLRGAESLVVQETGTTPKTVVQTQLETPTGQRGNLESWRPVLRQVAERIVANVREEGREAHLHLDPPELGKLDIQLVVEGSQIRAHIMAESAAVRALIQAHLPELKHALQEHRLELDTVRVDVQNEGGRRDTSSQNFPQEGRTSERGRNLGVLPTVEEEPEPHPLISPAHSRSRVSVWA